MRILKALTGLRRRLAVLVALLVVPAFVLLLISAREQRERRVASAQDTALGMAPMAATEQRHARQIARIRLGCWACKSARDM
jgi:hypothetical protein